MASISRPTWWSAYDRNPAYTSISRASTGLICSDISSHAGMPGAALGQRGVGGDHAELLLPGERLLADGVPALVEPALVAVGPLRRHVVRGVRGARREVHEERLVRGQRLLLAGPGDRLVGHVVHEVVALLGRAPRLDRRRVLVDRRVPLVRLAADEAVEVLEPAARVRPVVERSDRVRLPHRHLVALAELRRVVAVELEDLGDRSARVRPQRVVARRRRGDLGDAAHPDRVVVAARQQRRPRRRAQRRRVEAGELQPVGGEALERRRLARARRTRSTRRSRRRRSGSRARSVRPSGGRNRRIGGNLRVRRRGVVRDRARVGEIGDRQRRARNIIDRSHGILLGVAWGQAECSFRWRSKRRNRPGPTAPCRAKA